MLVRDRMTRNVTAAAPEWPLERARGALDRRGFRQLPVLRGTRLVGIVTDRDLRSAPARAKVVADVMTKRPVAVAPDLSVDEAARLLRERKIGAVPVVERGRVVGILSVADVLDAFVDLSGVREPTCRLVIALPAGRGAAADVCRLIERNRGEVKWIHRDATQRPARLHLRLKARHVGDVVTALEAAGFEVTAMVASGRKQ